MDKEQVEVFNNDIEAYVAMFCEECKPPISDMAKEPQSKWNACLMYVGKHVFYKTDKLKLNKYIDDVKVDKDLVDYLMNNAISNLKRAKFNHDIVEDYYVPAMDFDKVEILKNEIINRIFDKMNLKFIWKNNVPI